MCDEVIFCKMQDETQVDEKDLTIKIDEIKIDESLKDSIVFLPFANGKEAVPKKIVVDVEKNELLIETKAGWEIIQFNAKEIIVKTKEQNE